jgi:hypothetical protein
VKGLHHAGMRKGIAIEVAADGRAALEGTVIGRCMQRYRHQEFIRFLDRH